MTQLVEPTAIREPMSDEERKLALAALEEVSRHREAWLKERGGKLFSSAGALLDELDDERTAALE
ncbi:MAG: hypothetical protein ACYDCQ_05615 [Dehalococcoidia bacterium]